MRLVTSQIKNNLDEGTVRLIWDFYDEGYQNKEFDDYQFFKIESIDNRSVLKMWQEVPPALKIKSIPQHEECEIWIVKDENTETMMFYYEY